MKKVLLSVFAVMMVVMATAQKSFVDDANAELRTLTASFSSIKISGGIDLFLSQYETESIAVSASSPETRTGIKTVVENGVLKIYFDGGNNWKGNKKMKAYVSFKQLEKLEASGACDVFVAGAITVPTLKLDMSGASDFKGAVRVTSLVLELSGASDVKIEGTATTVSIESSGASDVKGYDLIAETCTAKASGASDINITVNKELNATASGASDIYYKGDPQLKDIHSSGASSVSRKS